MKRKVLFITLCLIIIFLNLTSSFVFADDVYGQNLWFNSTFDDDFNGYTFNSTTLNGGTLESVDGYSEHNGVRLYRENYSSNTRRCWINTSKPSVSTYKAGDSFTLSAWVRVDTQLTPTVNNIIPSSVIMVRGSSGDTPQIVIPKTSTVGEWVYYTNTFTATSNGYFNGCYVILGSNGAITVSNIKLEKGENATSWTPAPEDSTYVPSLLISILSILKNIIISALPIVLPVSAFIFCAINNCYSSIENVFKKLIKE